jgi:hypothetical protein
MWPSDLPSIEELNEARIELGEFYALLPNWGEPEDGHPTGYENALRHEGR